MKGDFTLFGFTPDPAGLLNQRISQRLGIQARRWVFGDAGALFFHSTYADMAETEAELAIKLGQLRSPDGVPLSTKALLRRGIVAPTGVNPERMRGNALVACLSKHNPVFSVYKTLLGLPQLYYTRLDGSLICSDRLACLCDLLDRLEPDEALVPMHYLFRSMPGEVTYYHGVRRMPPGMVMLCTGAELVQRRTGDLGFNGSNGSIRDGGLQAQDVIYEALRTVVCGSLAQAEALGEQVGVLLSGGIDSSLLQHIVAQADPSREARSYSYAVQAAGFAREVEYARQASRMYHTRHTFVEFGGDDFPGLLQRAVEHLAQPPVLETEPCILAVAERAAEAPFDDRLFVSGQGADALFGLNFSKKLKGLALAGRVPGASLWLQGLARLVKPSGRVSAVLNKGAAILAGSGNANLLTAPANTIAVYSSVDLICRCFGCEVVQAALRQRREWAGRFLRTDHYLEKVHVLDLVTDAYEVDVQRRQLFLAHHREQIHPFFDDDVLRAGFSIHPDVRYIKGWRPKHLLKSLLERKTGAPVARKPKGFSIFEDDLMQWMSVGGPLRPMIEAIDRPGFLSRADFERLLQAPDYFLWGLLTYDIFQKQVACRQPVREVVG